MVRKPCAEVTVQVQAARALSRIGDERAVFAFDYWLMFAPAAPANERPEVTLRFKVKQSRDELKARLDRERAAKLNK